MTEKELRKLSRLELLDMLIELSMENQNLKAKLAQAEEKLQSREIAIDKAGSIAEVAVQINAVYTATEAACRQYKDNIRLLNERQERICAQRDRESKVRAEQMLAQTQRTCDEMVSNAKKEAGQCWTELAEKLDAYVAQHQGLREMLSVVLTKTAE